MQRSALRLTAASAACLLSLGITAGPASADASVGAAVGVGLQGQSFDIGFEHRLRSALGTQFAGVGVGVIDGQLVLSGAVSPGVHAAVLQLVANLLGQEARIPVALGVAGPNLGLPIPNLGVGLDLLAPDISALLRNSGVVDHLRNTRRR